MKNQHEVEKLAYAMTRQRYLLNRDIVHDLFTELSFPTTLPSTALRKLPVRMGQRSKPTCGIWPNGWKCPYPRLPK